MKTILPMLCAAILLVFSAEAMQAARTAAQVFVSGVLPALFPMMVLCRLLPAPSIDGRSSQKTGFGTVLFAFLSGSPASAQRVRQAWDGGSLTPAQTERLLAMTGVMSPMFFTGTLAQWTGLPRAAWTMLGLHWFSALLTGWLWRLLPHAAPKAPPPDSAQAAQPSTLTGAISQSAQSLLAVCGAMMLFSIAAAVLRALLGQLFPDWTARHSQLLSVLWALLEIGGGSSAVLAAWPQPPMALLGALCSFGGLSIWLQNLLFAPACVRPVKLLGMRALHGALCYALCTIVFHCCPQLLQAADAGMLCVSPAIPVLLTLLTFTF